MAGISLGYKGISSRNYRNHFTFSPALFKAINFDSIVEWVTQVCLEDFQDIAAPPRVKMYPLVDFDFSESAIQLHHCTLQVQVNTSYI